MLYKSLGDLPCQTEEKIGQSQTDFNNFIGQARHTVAVWFGQQMSTEVSQGSKSCSPQRPSWNPKTRSFFSFSDLRWRPHYPLHPRYQLGNGITASKKWSIVTQRLAWSVTWFGSPTTPTFPYLIRRWSGIPEWAIRRRIAILLAFAVIRVLNSSLLAH